VFIDIYTNKTKNFKHAACSILTNFCRPERGLCCAPAPAVKHLAIALLTQKTEAGKDVFLALFFAPGMGAKKSPRALQLAG